MIADNVASEFTFLQVQGFSCVSYGQNRDEEEDAGKGENCSVGNYGRNRVSRELHEK